MVVLRAGGTCTDESGLLQRGDVLVSANDVDLTGMSHDDVWSTLRSLPDGHVRLTVHRPLQTTSLPTTDQTPQ